jgi:hypothetical protein
MQSTLITGPIFRAHLCRQALHRKQTQSIAQILYWTGRWARILREAGPNLGLRKQFMASPYLDFALRDFRMNCRILPDCGHASLTRLRDILENATKGRIAAH